MSELPGKDRFGARRLDQSHHVLQLWVGPCNAGAIHQYLLGKEGLTYEMEIGEANHKFRVYRNQKSKLTKYRKQVEENDKGIDDLTQIDYDVTTATGLFD